METTAETFKQIIYGCTCEFSSDVSNCPVNSYRNMKGFNKKEIIEFTPQYVKEKLVKKHLVCLKNKNKRFNYSEKIILSA